jgi:hypothetical protein
MSSKAVKGLSGVAEDLSSPSTTTWKPLSHPPPWLPWPSASTPHATPVSSLSCWLSSHASSLGPGE